MKSKSLMFVFATIFIVFTLITINAAGNVNITILLPYGNGTLYTSSNSSTILLNFTVLNKTTLAGANFTMTVDGVLKSTFCNSSTTTPVATPNGNASGCVGWDGSDSATVNQLYLNLSEGKHTVLINVTYGAKVNSSSVNETFYVNNFDSIDWSTGTQADYANLSNTEFIANITFNSRAIKNITFVLSNFTTVPTYSDKGIGWENVSINSLQNITNATGADGNTSVGISSWFIKWSNLTDKSYTYNITIKDANTNDVKVLTRHILLDTVNPTVSYSCSGYYNANTFEVEKDDSNFKCTCTGSDGNDTNPSETIIDSVSVSTTGSKGTGCKVTDHAGNNVTSSTVLYKVVELTTGEDYTGGTGNNIINTSSPTITGSSYAITAEQLLTGSTKSLSTNDGFKLSFRPSNATTLEQHTVKVSSITTSGATLIISSDPITFQINIGDEKKVDVDSDGTYDISVKLNQINNGKAEFTIKQISEKIPSSNNNQPNENIPEQPETNDNPDGLGTSSGSKTWIWVLLILLLIGIGVGIYYFMNKKK